MEFLKKNYEKVLLGVVLAGLTLAVCALPFIINAKRAALTEIRKTLTPHPAPLDPLVMTNEEAALQRAQSPVQLDYTTRHNLVNPVLWKKVNGQLIKEQTGKEEGPDALVVTAIRPLYLEISYGTNSASGYLINIERQAMLRVDKRHTQNFVSMTTKSELLTLRQIKGPPENPTELDLEWNETSEPVQITPTTPFRRVDGYEADLKYPLEASKNWVKQRVGSPAMNFFNGYYKIIAITESNVVVSAQPNEKRTTISFHPAN
jgi:hypothetical protein